MSLISALKQPNYRLYTGGSGLSLIGTWMQRVAVGWLTWQLTGSGAWLGLMAFADLFPTVLIGPFAGAMADRWDRLLVTKISQSLAMCQAIILCLLTAAGVMTIWLLLLLTAFLGAVAALNQPSRLALIPSLVPEKDLTAAVAFNSVIFNLARFIGPALAGIVIVSFDVAVAFGINAITFTLFLLALSRISLPRPAVGAAPPRSLISGLVQGFTYTVSHQGIAALLALLIAASIGARPVVELLPGFAAGTFRAGAGGLAILTSSIGVGAILGGLWLSRRQGARGLTRVILVNTFVLVAATSGFALTTSLWTGAAALVMAGSAMASTGIATQIAIQLAVQSDMRGRVLSLYGLIFRGGPALGALAMGAASTRFGLSLPVIAGAGLLGLAAGAVLLRRRPIARSLEAGADTPMD
jgi:predicted MFS family arabinose efflux permease